MKKTAIVLILLLMVSIVCTGYLYMTSGMTVKDVTVSATEASVYPELFEYLKRESELGAVNGTGFSADFPESMEECQFLTFTVGFRNQAFIQADTVEITVSPMESDILQLPEEKAVCIADRSEGTAQATILTKAGTHPVRELLITYYMWGVPMSMRANSSN